MLAIIVILILLLVAAFAAGQLTNDQHTISREYSKISMPSSIQYSSKKWIASEPYDSEIKPVWQYTYTIRHGKNSDQVVSDIKSTLQKQGFSLQGDFPVDGLDQSNFKMQKGGLRLYIDIGSPQGEGNANRVIVEAQNGD